LEVVNRGDKENFQDLSGDVLDTQEHTNTDPPKSRLNLKVKTSPKTKIKDESQMSSATKKVKTS
jgi:hypothetical protein